ncbi:MAG: ABC transporter permease subunit [Candidatus Eremiobacteraeota bacterium]|nr:ABC transporter permease subunit [Candidatus Eremiobacteraeota bacterium]
MRRRLPDLGAALFAVALLYPFVGLVVPVGPWRWDFGPMLSAVRVSIGLTALAMVAVVALGTPLAVYVVRRSTHVRLWWQAILLVSVLLPPLAIGILLSLAFGPRALGDAGRAMVNTPLAFIVTQTYVSIGYYALGAIAALQTVPRGLELQAALLGHTPWSVFWRVTFPLARLGFAVALSLAWVRALTEFGAVVITAYYPSGMPVAIWANLENFGLPAVMPLLVIFLATALPIPWLVHIVAQRRVLSEAHLA